MLGVPYFIFNRTLSNYLELKKTQNARVVLAMFETKLYMKKKRRKKVY
jgi:hypothetical protein